MLTIWKKIPVLYRWILAAVLALAVAFTVGRFTAPTKTVTVTKTETVTQVVEKEVQVVQYKDRVVTQYVNQATVKIDKDTDCVETFDKNTGKMVTRHCVVSVDTNSEHKDSGSTVATKEGVSTTTTNTETNTKTSTVTTTAPPVTASRWSVSVIVSEALNLNGFKFSPSYGADVGYRLVGPLSLSLEAYSSKDILGSLSLGSKTAMISADVGTNLSSFGKMYFGGCVGHKFLGPVWVGAFGYSNGIVGLSASIRAF